jgi:probable phosphoglycerate mutase
MIQLLLIRHGETAWNAERRLQGHLDIPLNAIGIQQAQALATALKSEQLDAVVCSDLQRAQQTAAAIAQAQGLTSHIQPAWRERCFGGFEGQLIAELEGLFPLEYAAWRAHEIDNQFPANAQGQFTGESISQFHSRIETAFIQLSQQYPNQKVAVVAHGGVLECAYRIAQQLSLDAPREVTMLNASINRFELSQHQQHIKLTLIEWGTVAHLTASLDEIIV